MSNKTICSRNFFKLFLLLTFWGSICYAKNKETDKVRLFEVDSKVVVKDLSHSYGGYDAMDWTSSFGGNPGVDFKWLLNEGRDEFKKYCRLGGVRVLRLAQMSRYSWRGADESKKMFALKYARNKPQRRKQLESEPLKYSWVSPDSLFSFCKENNILLFPGLNSHVFYDGKTGQARFLPGQSEYYQASADEFAAYLKWLKDKGYTDNIIAWELGHECYSLWEPKEFAKWAKIVIATMKKVDPKVKFSVQFYAIAAQADPDVKWVMERIKAGEPEIASKEWARYEKWMEWLPEVLKYLDEKDMESIPYGLQQSYGAQRKYKSCYRGLQASRAILEAFDKTKNMPVVFMEWRETSGDNRWIHRSYRQSALWRAKWVLTMMGHPGIQYHAAHSIFIYGGGLFWSDGKEWKQFSPAWDSQGRGGRSETGLPDLNGTGKPRIDMGAYSVVLKMCNDLIDTHPLMLAYGADLGPESSSLYFESYSSFYSQRRHKKIADLEIKGDVQWLISTDKNRKSLAAIFVNTNNKEIPVRFAEKNGRVVMGSARVERLTCDSGMLDVLEMPGMPKPWRTVAYQNQGQNTVFLEPNSVTKVIVPIVELNDNK